MSSPKLSSPDLKAMKIMSNTAAFLFCSFKVNTEMSFHHVVCFWSYSPSVMMNWRRKWNRTPCFLIFFFYITDSEYGLQFDISCLTFLGASKDVTVIIILIHGGGFGAGVAIRWKIILKYSQWMHIQRESRSQLRFRAWESGKLSGNRIYWISEKEHRVDVCGNLLQWYIG